MYARQLDDDGPITAAAVEPSIRGGDDGNRGSDSGCATSEAHGEKEAGPPVKKNGPVLTAFLMTNTMIGVGILDIPFAFRHSGIAMGLLLFAVFGFMTWCVFASSVVAFHGLDSESLHLSPSLSISLYLSPFPVAESTCSHLIHVTPHQVQHEPPGARRAALPRSGLRWGRGTCLRFLGGEVRGCVHRDSQRRCTGLIHCKKRREAENVAIDVVVSI